MCARIGRNLHPPGAGKKRAWSGGISAYAALREALANCLIHADYWARQGIEIAKTREGISFSNPGSEVAKRYCAEIVIAYLTDHASASVGEIAALLDVQASRAQAVLDSLLQWKIATKDGNGENAVYRLSS